jgi:uncharacterized radical SAM superfamily Fe-S cluster-containing enzyme
MSDRVRPYLFYDTALSICSRCYRKAEGKIIFQNGQVLLLRRCPVHGHEKTLLADDIEYYKLCRERFIKPPEAPLVRSTPVRYGCPYDCGLCPDHEQHSCVCLLEVTDACNLSCPVCYAGSGPEPEKRHRPLDVIERMLDTIVAGEGEPDIVQISGGEPTLHADFFEILDMARRRPIRHLMINTNGVRFARDERFAERLAEYKQGLELYLQFDSLDPKVHLSLRGVDLRSTRRRALDRANELGLGVTLVATLQKGLNDSEIGAMVEFAAREPCVRGITLQPVQMAGRVQGFDPASDRLTLTEVRRKVLEQTSLFKPADIVPVPCHPDCLAMAYGLKIDGQITPLTGLVPHQTLIDGASNTVLFSKDPALRAEVLRLFSASLSPEAQNLRLKELLCCLPSVEVPAELTSDKVFRLLILQFIDAYSFDLRSVKKTCIHIATPDGRLIPFDTFNLFYRGGLERSTLVPLRREVERGAGVS